jgi:hypothetical protein
LTDFKRRVFALDYIGVESNMGTEEGGGEEEIYLLVVVVVLFAT